MSKGTGELKPLNLTAMGRRIWGIREVRGYTREELAEILELSPQFIADVEYGNKGISVRTLYHLAQALNVSANYIISGCKYDIEQDENAKHICEDIKDVLETLDLDALRGFRNISRVYVDTVQELVSHNDKM